MVVWICNPFDSLPGEGARLQRYGLLCKAFAQVGHHVVWWSSDWNHVKKNVRNASLGKIDGVDIRLIPTFPYRRNIGLSRVFSHWRYACSWERLGCQAVRRRELAKPDLIVASLPPLDTAVILQRLCKRLNAVGVVDIMDAWPETFERVFPYWTLAPLRFLARKALRGADAVSAVGQTYLAIARQHIAESKPSYMCYHGVEINPIGRTASASVLRFLYIGNMASSYDLLTWVRAFAELKKEGLHASLDLVGDGPLRPAIQLEIEKMQVSPCVRLHEWQTSEGMAQFLRQADVGVVPNIPDSYVAVPYKLADYTAAGVPVLSCLTGETHDLIRKYAAGWHYTAGDVQSLKATIRTLIEQKASPDVQTAGTNARHMAETCFDAKQIYPAFVNWLEGIVRH